MLCSILLCRMYYRLRNVEWRFSRQHNFANYNCELLIRTCGIEWRSRRSVLLGTRIIGFSDKCESTRILAYRHPRSGHRQRSWRETQSTFLVEYTISKIFRVQKCEIDKKFSQITRNSSWLLQNASLIMHLTKKCVECYLFIKDCRQFHCKFYRWRRREFCPSLSRRKILRTISEIKFSELNLLTSTLKYILLYAAHDREITSFQRRAKITADSQLTTLIGSIPKVIRG